MVSNTETAFIIEDLHVSIAGMEILKGVDLVIQPGEVHALMGPNGSGKSTLANAIMGHPTYQVTSGRILFKGEDLTKLRPEDRAQKGVFVAFQNPTPIPGVTLAKFIRTSLNSVRSKEVSVSHFQGLLKDKMKLLRIEDDPSTKNVNDGLSGGEKKRTEILQMAILQPQIAILDETDSGLDIDALKVVADSINSLTGPQMSVLLITHYRRILDHIKPHQVHIMAGGRIIRSGGLELVDEVEARGYDPIVKESGAEASL